MLEKVRSRPEGVSIRTVVRDWSQWGQLYWRRGGLGNFMYKQGSKWVGFDSRVGDVPEALQIKLEDARRDLREGLLVDFGTSYPGYEYPNYEAAALLSRFRQLAGSTGDLSKKYAEWLATNQRSGDPTETVAETVGPRDYPDALAGDADALAGGADALIGDGVVAGGVDAIAGDAGDDICYFADCGSKTEVAGGTFSERIGANINEFIREVEVAYSSLPADQIRTLRGELSDILGALGSHINGSLQLMKAELQIRLPLAAHEVNPTDAVLEESHRILSGWASELALLRGLADALRPDELYIAGRAIRYSVKHQDYEGDGQSITILRVKENKKPSWYVAWMRANDLWHHHG